MQEFIRGFITAVRYVQPIMSIVIMLFSFMSVFKLHRKNYRYTVLLDDMTEIQLYTPESFLGSDSSADVYFESAQPFHGIITATENTCTVRPCKKSRIAVNGKLIKKETAISSYDVLSAAGREFSVRKKTTAQKLKSVSSFLAFTALNLFQILMALSFVLTGYSFVVLLCFFVFMIAQWIYLCLTRFKNAAVEIPVLYCLTLGLSVAAKVSLSALIKQEICMFAGLIGALLLYKIIINKTLFEKLKLVAVLVSLGLFAANILIGNIYNGAQNWIEIFGVSFQPSELIKVIYIFVSTASFETAVKGKNTLYFVVYSFCCIGILAYLSDFGTALVYFVVLIAVLILRRCNKKIVISICSAAVLCAAAAVIFFPYIARRFLSFGQAWQNAYSSGYQQTRTMIAIASGGLFGVGTGQGNLSYVAASDTDIVFGLISEEWGLIVAMCAALCFVLLAVFAVKCFAKCPVLYAIPVCASAILILAQAALNIFGSVDMLPFTGVTLPFISNGGSSVISCIMLIAYFAAAGVNNKKEEAL